MSTDPQAIDDVYFKVWQPLIEDDLGQYNVPVMRTLLFDYGATLHNLSILYPYLTNGTITDPQAHVDEVMVASDRFVADTVDSEVERVLDFLLKESLRTDIKPNDRLVHLTKTINNLLATGSAEA